MKRTISWILCLIMAFACVSALGETEITVQEKMARQLQEGSGLKGIFTLEASGEETPLYQAIRGFLGYQFQIRSMRNRKDLHAYVYQDLGDEQQNAVSELYLLNGAVFVRSDFLGDTVYSLPETDILVDRLFTPEGGNPSFASLLLSMARMTDQQYKTEWSPVLAPYLERLEVWLNGFAAETKVRKDDAGNTVIEICYVIPMNAVNAEIVALLKQAVADPDFMAILKKTATAEQYELLSNPNLSYFFEAALATQEDGGDLILSRTASSRGEEIASSIELPMNEARTGFTRLTIDNRDSSRAYILTGEEKTVSVKLDPKKGIAPDKQPEFLVAVSLPADEKHPEARNYAFRVQTVWEGSDTPETEEDKNQHHREKVTFTLTEDLSAVPEGMDPALFEGQVKGAELDVDLHYYSNAAKNKPVTLEVEAALKLPENEIGFTGKFKSAAPWVFNPFSVDSSVDLLDMTAEERAALLARFLEGSDRLVTPAATPVSAETPVPEPTPTPEPAPEADQGGEPEETDGDAA